jgi:Secretion system C-terminal sorting domain
MFTLKDLDCNPLNLVNPNNGQQALSQKTNDFTVQTIPNPVSNMLDILLSTNNEQPIHFLLYDAFGKVIYRQTKVTSYQFSIDMSNFANGLYILSTRQGDITVQKKIVKVSAR